MTTDYTKRLRRYQWVAWGMLLFGILASLGGNVLYAPNNPVAQAISALPAISFLGTMWFLERIPWDKKTVNSYVALLALLIVAGVSAWISYWHMAHVALSYGQETTSAHLLPVAVDGWILASSMSLLRLGYLLSEEAKKERPREGGEDQESLLLDPPRSLSPQEVEAFRDMWEAPEERPLDERVRENASSEEAPQETVLEETVTETRTTTRRATSRGGDLSELVSRLREGVEAGKTPLTISGAKTYLSVGHTKAKDVVALLQEDSR